MLAVDTVIDDRQMRALTGLDLAAVCALSEPFVAGCQQEADARFSEQRPRQRRAGGGRKGVLASPKQKLLFILYYLKAYPTSDELAATFGLSRSKACEHAHRLARALERTLRTARRAAGPRHRLAGPDAGRLRRCARAAARCHRTPVPAGAGGSGPAGRLFRQKKGPPVKTRSSPTRCVTSTTWDRPSTEPRTTTRCSKRNLTSTWACLTCSRCWPIWAIKASSPTMRWPPRAYPTASPGAAKRPRSCP